jgi:malonate transporter and related proteins
VLGAILDVTLPVFGMMLCGYAVVRAGWLDQQGADILNRFVYRLAFPALLFAVVARTPVDQIFYWPFLVAWMVSLSLMYALAAVASVAFYRDGLAALGVRGMNVSCASTAFMGIPLSIYAFGNEAALAAILATTIIVTVFFSVTLLLIEAGRDASAGAKPTLRSIAASLGKNPLMLAVVAGAASSALGLELPRALVRFLDVVGAAAIPCSLVALGIFVASNSIGLSLRGASVPVAMKLALHPLLTWVLVTKVFPLDPFWAKSTVLLSALPTATSCFVIAQQHNAIPAESSGTIWLSTVLSLLSVSAVLALY